MKITALRRTVFVPPAPQYAKFFYDYLDLCHDVVTAGIRSPQHGRFPPEESGAVFRCELLGAGACGLNGECGRMTSVTVTARRRSGQAKRPGYSGRNGTALTVALGAKGNCFNVGVKAPPLSNTYETAPSRFWRLWRIWGFRGFLRCGRETGFCRRRVWRLRGGRRC